MQKYCILLDSYEGYRKARAILLSRYSRSHIIARSCIEKLLHSEQITALNMNELLVLDMAKVPNYFITVRICV